MAEPNALFCVIDRPEDRVRPCPEAVKQHKGCGAVWIPPGVTFSQAAHAIKEYAELPSTSAFSFLDPWGDWVRLRPVRKDHVVQPGETYYFRVVALGLERRKMQSGRALPIHQRRPLFLREGNVPEAAFQSFFAKGSTQLLCKEMVKDLEQITNNSGDDFKSEFRERFQVAVCCGDWWELFPSPAGVVLKGNRFSVAIVVKPGVNAYIQSSLMTLNEQDELCLKELGFIYWIVRLLKVKPDLQTGQDITLSGADKSMHVEIVQDLKVHATISNSVFRVRDDRNRELVFKIGHSSQCWRLMEDLCVASLATDQVVNESSILQKLKGISSATPLVYSGYWDSRPVLLTEMQGRSLEDNDLPLESAMVERLCKDLTYAVLELHAHGVIHGDIKPDNVGVYARPEEHEGRRFYLYDFGFALEVPREPGKKAATNKMFSSADTLETGVVTLVTELVSVVYVCLYLAGIVLPWQQVLDWGPSLACSLRRDGSLLKNSIFMELKDALREWFVFVLELPSDAGVEQVRMTVDRLLSNHM